MQEYFGTDEMAYTVGSPNVRGAPELHDSFSEGLQDGIELRILQGTPLPERRRSRLSELGQKAAALAAERLAPAE